MARVKRGVTKHARHKKILAAAKGLEEDKKIHLGQLCKELRKIDNMPTETERIKKENLENYGLLELMQHAEHWV